MINRIFIIILLLAVKQFSGGTAQAAVLLKSISRADTAAQLDLSFQCDQLPAFTTKTSGRKVDLELEDTVLTDTQTFPATDERMIKIVSNQQKSKTVLSFYFRYPPQKVTAESNKDTATIILHILLGNPLSSASTEFSIKPQGAAPVNQAKPDELNPVQASLYAKNWISFFTEYESQVDITAPAKLFLPPFPLAAALQPNIAGETWLPAEIAQQAKENKWTQVCHLLRSHLPNQPDEQLKERLVLAYAEALVRSGEYREPHILLQKITLQYPNSPMASLAQFLLIYQQAAKGDHIAAYYDLEGLLKKPEQNTQLTPYFNILLAELALLAGRPKDAEQLLVRDDIIGNEQFNTIRLLRQADLLYVKNEKARALTAYLNLAGQSAIIDSDPMSLAHFCDTLYNNKRFLEAAKKYRLLGDLLNNRPQQDKALFRLAMSLLHNPATEKKVGGDLLQIQNAFPGTEGGTRAQLKQTDLDFVSKRMDAVTAGAVYRTIAGGGYTVILREEASFKQALVSRLAGDQQTSVTQCMEMLRSFQSGKLRMEAKALLIEQLPGVIKQLVNNKEYMKALVLAKQNKTFFNQGWLNTGILYDLANAYSKLGMANQTAQTYQYLFEISSEAEKEKIYLPLIQGLFAADQYAQVEEYADRYLLRYPKGNDEPAILLLKIRALNESGQPDKAIQLFKPDARHQTPQHELLKARIFFELQQWHNVIDTLTKPEMLNLLVQNNGLSLLAESYFQTGQENLAAPLYRRIVEQGKSIEQAQFRLAQIESKKNNTSQALNLFKELAEKGKDPQWTKLAREEAAILQLKQKY